MTLIEQIKRKQTNIESWLEKRWRTVKPSFYSSIDLRHSTHKLGPVDVNLYPAGFNNLSSKARQYAMWQMQQLLAQYCPNARHVLLIIENHTRNLYYLENVLSLQEILTHAGFVVKVSSLSPVPQTLYTASKKSLCVEVINKRNNQLYINDFVPDCIILNNDLADGMPALLSNINQPIFPPATLGWYQRRKSQYFQHYQSLCQAFSKEIGIDDWLINPLFATCRQVNFDRSADQSELIKTAENLLSQIQKKYDHYQIQESPYLVLKADSGSYGMGVMGVEDPSTITHLSRKQRQHMAKTKGNRPIEDIILQEGIPTITRFNERIAEPVLYMVGKEVSGGFYRTHEIRSIKDNLNTPGMQLIPFDFQDSYQSSDDQLYAYQVIARLSALAAALEIQSCD